MHSATESQLTKEGDAGAAKLDDRFLKNGATYFIFLLAIPLQKLCYLRSRKIITNYLCLCQGTEPRSQLNCTGISGNLFGTFPSRLIPTSIPLEAYNLLSDLLEIRQ